jgi:hypothetical protein
MNRVVIAWVVLAALGAVFVGVGFANQREFQFAAIHESERQIKRAFIERGEHLAELGKPNYSFGRVEMTARTDKAEYVVTVLVTNPDWVSLTALNLFVAPTVSMHGIEKR